MFYPTCTQYTVLLQHFSFKNTTKVFCHTQTTKQPTIKDELLKHKDWKTINEWPNFTRYLSEQDFRHLTFLDYLILRWKTTEHKTKSFFSNNKVKLANQEICSFLFFSWVYVFTQKGDVHKLCQTIFQYVRTHLPLPNTVNINDPYLYMWTMVFCSDPTSLRGGVIFEQPRKEWVKEARWKRSFVEDPKRKCFRAEVLWVWWAKLNTFNYRNLAQNNCCFVLFSDVKEVIYFEFITKISNGFGFVANEGLRCCARWT